MERTISRLTAAVPETDDRLFNVAIATDPESDAVLHRISFPLDVFGPSSHVVIIDPVRGSYRSFTLTPADVAGDARRISHYISSKQQSDVIVDEAPLSASLLDLHSRRLALEARAVMVDAPVASVIRGRRDYCLMSGNVEIDTWEPARLPVSITNISSMWLGYPSTSRLRSWGFCWAAPQVNVRWDGDIWTTTWSIEGCYSRQRSSGCRTIAAVQSQAYNDDFPLNTSRVWVSHLAQLHHDDPSGRIWYQGYAGTAGGVSQSMLASGINIANSWVGSNCR